MKHAAHIRLVDEDEQARLAEKPRCRVSMRRGRRPNVGVFTLSELSARRP